MLRVFIGVLLGVGLAVGGWWFASHHTAQVPAAGSLQIATTTQTTASGTIPLGAQTTSNNKYPDGILSLGDGKYTTTGPEKGYVYLCNVAQGGEGAEVDGPWITGGTWNVNEKPSVEGSITWPDAYVHITVSGGVRTIASNDLPTNHNTGIFPIQQSDPAYQYDPNPNSIEAQDLEFNLPANPAFAPVPSCIYGEVGIMTNGVLLLDAFDAEYRDAAAHEMQDSCQGHPHEGGIYHYHSLSSCIPDATATNIIGWAFDGFPITGPKLPNGNYLTTSDLDECHGMTSDIIENGQMVNAYHYVMTEDFPYSVGCFMGKSYEPVPAAPQNQMQTATSSGQGGQQNGAPMMPPQAALDACSGKSTGASCSFSAPQGQINGTCQSPPNSSLACVPQ